MTIRVMLVDDQALIRRGLRLILETEDDIEVVAEADDGLQAVVAVGLHRPDVVLMDIRMPNLDGIGATRRICSNPDLSGTAVLVLTTYEADEYVFEALRAGACGFVLKHISPEDLVAAVRAIAAGGGLIAPSITRRLIAEFASIKRPATPPSLEGLTKREREVLELVGRGLSNAEIAAHLFLGEATVKTHLGHILAKLQLRDRVQAVICAYETGLVSPSR
jgi:DNA-binding NarL/FixJ family response regulator